MNAEEKLHSGGGAIVCKAAQLVKYKKYLHSRKGSESISELQMIANTPTVKPEA